MPAKYKIIAQELRNQILLTKSLTPYKLPTEQELCRKYQASRQTIRQALYTLEEEKLIARRQGSGAYTIPQTEHLREKKIILLISEDNEYTYPKFISTLHAELRKQHLTLAVHLTKNDINIERSILQSLLEESVFILLVEGVQSAFPNPNVDLYEKLQFTGTKILFINHPYTQLSNAISIYSEDIAGGMLLGDHLISMQRYNPFAILPDFAENAGHRYAGLQMAYRNRELHMPTQNIFRYSEKELHTLRSRQDTGFLTDFIRSHSAHCDSVLCYSDEIAYWLIKELAYAGISVPGQIAVVSFDNSYLCTLSRPSITSLSSDELIKTICRMVMDILHEKKVENKILPWELISRGSTKTNS